MGQVRVKDGKKNMHISKNWKKDEGLDTEMYYWSVCWDNERNGVAVGRMNGMEWLFVVIDRRRVGMIVRMHQ